MASSGAGSCSSGTAGLSGGLSELWELDPALSEEAGSEEESAWSDPDLLTSWGEDYHTVLRSQQEPGGDWGESSGSEDCGGHDVTTVARPGRPGRRLQRARADLAAAAALLECGGDIGPAVAEFTRLQAVCREELGRRAVGRRQQRKLF